MTVREMIWDSLLTADYHSRYFGEIANRMERYERNLKLAVGIASSAAFIALAINIESKIGFGYLTELIALATTILGWSLLLMKFEEKASLSGSLHKEWSRIQRQHQQLWVKINAGLSEKEAVKRWESIESMATPFSEQASRKFKFDRELAQRIQKETVKARLPRQAA